VPKVPKVPKIKVSLRSIFFKDEQNTTNLDHFLNLNYNFSKFE